MFFDGVNDQITIPHHVDYNFGSGDFSIELVFNLSASQKNSHPVFISNRLKENEFSGFLIGLTEKGFIQALFNGNVVSPFSGGGAVDYSDNLCHHLVLVRNDTEVSIYVDGVKVWADFIPAETDVSTSQDIWIGRDQADASRTNTLGALRELRLWDKSLSITEINAQGNRFVLDSPSNLIGYWRLNGKSGQIVKDQSLRANDGFLGLNSEIEDNDASPIVICPILAKVPDLHVQTNNPLCPGDSLQLQVTGGIENPNGFNYTVIDATNNQINQGFNNSIALGNNQLHHLIVYGLFDARKEVFVQRRSTEECFPIDVYDLVTPNGDGRNDFFCIQNLERYGPVRLTVFDKWGNLIYETQAYNNDWSGVEVVGGYYYYELLIGDIVKKGRLFVMK